MDGLHHPAPRLKDTHRFAGTVLDLVLNLRNRVSKLVPVQRLSHRYDLLPGTVWYNYRYVNTHSVLNITMVRKMLCHVPSCYVHTDQTLRSGNTGTALSTQDPLSYETADHVLTVYIESTRFSGIISYPISIVIRWEVTSRHRCNHQVILVHNKHKSRPSTEWPHLKSPNRQNLRDRCRKTKVVLRVEHQKLGLPDPGRQAGVEFEKKNFYSLVSMYNMEVNSTDCQCFSPDTHSAI